MVLRRDVDRYGIPYRNQKRLGYIDIEPFYRFRAFQIAQVRN